MDKKAQQYIFGGTAVIALIVLGIFIAHRMSAVPMAHYKNDTYGISFDYPNTYALSERDASDRHSITLADKTALAKTPQNGEAPTAMSFDIFKNPKQLTARQWARANAASNYQLSDGTLASSTVSGREAVAYVWSGLYLGESYAFSYQKRVLLASVTFTSERDRILNDFAAVLRTLVLQ